MVKRAVPACLALLLAGCSEPDGPWPQWRGPDRSGVSTETGLLKQWPPGGPPLEWRATGLGDGYSSVAVSGGRVYTQGMRDGADWIFALDASNGQMVWSQEAGDEYDNERGDGPRGTPTVVGSRVYVLDASGDLSCLSAKTGEPVWHVNIFERFGTENIKWGLSESPLVDGNHVIVSTGSPEGSIVAFDRRDGDLVWQSTGLTDEPGYASALVEDVGGVRQIIQVTGEAVVGVRAEDGKPLWRYEKASNDTANCTTPVYDNGHLFVTSGYDTGGALLKLTSNGSETTAEEVYFTRDMMNHHGGVVLVDGYLYGFSNKTLTCLDFMTGEQMWEARSVGKGSLTAADGMLYILSEEGHVGLVRATPDSYQEVSRFQIPRKRLRSRAHPVVADGKLYLRNSEDLLCFDIKAQG